jgi:hypothetical protein
LPQRKVCERTFFIKTATLGKKIELAFEKKNYFDFFDKIVILYRLKTDDVGDVN